MSDTMPAPFTVEDYLEVNDWLRGTPVARRDADAWDAFTKAARERAGVALREYNPYHDEAGRFTTADGNVTGSGVGTKGAVAPVHEGAFPGPERKVYGYSWRVGVEYVDTPEALQAARDGVLVAGRAGFERGFLTDGFKTIVAGVEGDATTTPLDGFTRKELEGATFVHSHPHETGFSGADLMACLTNKMGAIEAVMPSGAAYRATWKPARGGGSDSSQRWMASTNAQLFRAAAVESLQAWRPNRAAAFEVDELANLSDRIVAAHVLGVHLSQKAGVWTISRIEDGRTVRETRSDDRDAVRQLFKDAWGYDPEAVHYLSDPSRFLRDMASYNPAATPLREAERGDPPRVTVIDDGELFDLLGPPGRVREARRAVRLPNRKNRPLPIDYVAVFGSPDQRKYRAAVRAAEAAIGAMDEADRLRLLQTFADYRRQLVDALLAIQTQTPRPNEEGTTWEAFHLQQLIGAVDNVTARFAARYRDAHMQGVLNSWKAGRMTAPWAMEKAGVALPAQALSVHQIEAAVRYSASLVTHINARIRAQVDSIIYTSIMGRESGWDVTKRLARLLDPTPHMGTSDPRALRTGPGFNADPRKQALTVMRTEKGRVYSMATGAQLREMARYMPGLQKKWMHSGNVNDPRPYHRNVLHGQVKPMSGKFNVNGELAWGPHDPALSAGNCINCGCSLVPWHATWADFDTTDEREAIRDELVADWMERYRGESSP